MFKLLKDLTFPSKPQERTFDELAQLLKKKYVIEKST